MSTDSHSFQLGLQAERAGNRDQAACCYRQAIENEPNLAEAHFRLANLAADSGDIAEALKCYTAARRLRPDVADVHLNIGTLLKDQGDFREAERCFREALALDADSALANNNLGTVLQFRGAFPAAEDCYRKAIAVAPAFAGAWINLGNLLADVGRIDDATSCFDTALRIAPGSREARFNRALAWIRSGNLRDGWREYESRFGHKVVQRSFPFRRWNGPGDHVAALLVYAEQGIGDEIMFASCLPEVFPTCRDCFLECEPRLTRLLARSFPAANVFARPVDALLQRQAVLPPMDAQIPLGTLPMWLRNDWDAFPARRGYLRCDTDAVSRWKGRYRELGDGLKVGVSWRGGRELHVRRQRSTQLADWSPILQLDGFRFVNLQYGDCGKEIAALHASTGSVIHDWDDSDPLGDLDDFAAKVAALDLVITVDNSNAHLAGALGVDVWTLLPFAADFRWFAERDDSPWYPTMRLVRQTAPGAWHPVIARVAEDLRALAAPVLRHSRPGIDLAALRL